MQYGFVLEGGDPKTASEVTQAAEAAGWDAVFMADGIDIGYPGAPTLEWFDPWIVLAAMAMRTQRIRIGTMITPVPRRRPWKLARETVTLDHLSKGRLIFGVGLGAAEHDGGFCKVGEAMDLKARAQRLDEGLAILSGLWSGKPFSFTGEHYNMKEMTMLPTPVQPRIPVWVPGVWTKARSMERALRWDGIIPQKYKSMERMTPSEVEELKRYVGEHRSTNEPFDIVVGGTTPGSNRKRAAATVRPFQEAGATWWLEHSMASSWDKLRKRVEQGPPREV